MGFPLYSCDRDFPERILPILEDEGFTVESLPPTEEQLDQCSQFFSFRVKHGLAGIRVTGSEEDGMMIFFVVFANSTNPLSWRPSSRLSRKIVRIMLRNGARLIEEDETD